MTLIYTLTYSTHTIVYDLVSNNKCVCCTLYYFDLFIQKNAEDLKTEISNQETSLIPLFKSIEGFKQAASKINNEIKVQLMLFVNEMLVFHGNNRNKILKGMQETKAWASMWQSQYWRVRELNDRLMMAERAFTDREGLLGRQWYKHLVRSSLFFNHDNQILPTNSSNLINLHFCQIYAPSKHDDYGSVSFPGIGDAIENAKGLNTAESWRSVQHEIWSL